MSFKSNRKFLLLFLTLLITTVPVLSRKRYNWKRDTSLEEGLEVLIENQIESIPEDAFGSDVIFEQHVDKTNAISTYKLLNEDKILYEKIRDDSKKSIVILTKDEDKIPFKKVKRLHVVLHKGSDGKYGASTVMIRDAVPADKNLNTIEGTHKVIEWLSYDTHLIPGRTLEVLTAVTCISSILVTCTFNEAALTPSDKFIPSPPYVPKIGTQEQRAEVASIPLLTEDGFDPNDNYDFYYDLEASKIQQGRFMGTLFGEGGILGNGLIHTGFSIAGGVVCFALLILGACGKVQGTDYTVVNESGQPLDEATLQQLTQGAAGRRKREVDRSADFPGWKTQYLQLARGITLSSGEEIFYGFGNCPPKPAKIADLQNLNTPQDIVNFYLAVLRTDCLDTIRLIILELLKDGILSLDVNTKVFKLNADHEYVSHKKLNLKETLRLSGAAELAAFSNVFAQRVAKPQENSTVTVGKRPVSRSIHFIAEVALTHLNLVREVARNHLLLLTRDLLLNVNMMFTKLSQDTQNLERCADCTEDKDINLNDRIYIMALKQFILQGLGPVEKGSDAFQTFEKFYNNNENTIEKIVHVYS